MNVDILKFTPVKRFCVPNVLNVSLLEKFSAAELKGMLRTSFQAAKNTRQDTARLLFNKRLVKATNDCY